MLAQIPSTWPRTLIALGFGAAAHLMVLKTYLDWFLFKLRKGYLEDLAGGEITSALENINIGVTEFIGHIASTIDDNSLFLLALMLLFSSSVFGQIVLLLGEQSTNLLKGQQDVWAEHLAHVAFHRNEYLIMVFERHMLTLAILHGFVGLSQLFGLLITISYALGGEYVFAIMALILAVLGTMAGLSTIRGLSKQITTEIQIFEKLIAAKGVRET